MGWTGGRGHSAALLTLPTHPGPEPGPNLVRDPVEDEIRQLRLSPLDVLGFPVVPVSMDILTVEEIGHSAPPNLSCTVPVMHRRSLAIQ